MSEATPLADIKDLARRLAHSPRERLAKFRTLDLPERSAVFNELSPVLRLSILEELTFAEAVELLDYLDPQRAQYILARLPSAARRRKIITRLKNDMYEKVDHFLQFHPRSTLSLIHLNYVYLADSLTIGETAGVIERHLIDTGKVPVVLVSQNGSLSGEVPLDTLVRERNSAKLKNHQRDVLYVSYNEDHQKVMSLFIDNPHKKVVVLDGDGSVLGIIYSDDVLELFAAQPATSLYSFAGVTESERPFDGVVKKVTHRYRWLILNLGTAFLAASVVAAFEDTISRYVLIAMYMPIVAGMGGNAATQTLAVMVRGISIGEISLKNCAPAVWNEIKAGFINGAITGMLVFLIALIFNTDILLGVVAGVSVMASLVIAGFFGAIVPLVLKHFGKDPATSATVFITTATDVFGFLFLLGIATMFLF